MLANWFAHPAPLWTLLAAPVALVFFVYAYFRRKQLIARLGSPLLLRKSILTHPRVRRWKASCVLLGIVLVGLACAGPQWGLDKSAQYRKGRDVILVLDLSRSMSAEQPSRRKRAVDALRHLANTFEEHGGNRVALVAFAAKPRLFFPLTYDCDHLRHTLAQIEANDYPPLTVEEPISGTRIGAALKLALEAFDPVRANRPVIVLVSDGDDPAADDEWRVGIQAAQAKRVHVHTVGVGDPLNAETISIGNDVLRYDGEPIRTKLNEKLLQEIARETGGQYLPAQRTDFPLGTFVQHLLDADELRQDDPADSSLPVYQLRYAWFLAPALLLFLLTMLLNEGPRPPRKEPKMPPAKTRAKAIALVVAMAALVCISAADPPAAESLLRQGNDAFAREEHDLALEFFEKAEALAQDPGRVSFNKAAAYYRLERYKEAIECYRRALDDDHAPADRIARASFNLGNSLVQQGSDSPQQLAEAVAAYRGCLHQPDLPAKLRSDARHNLELAQLLWLQAKAKQSRDTVPPKDKPEKPIYPKGAGKDPKKEGTQYVRVDPTVGAKPQQADDAPIRKDGKSAKAGVIVVLPDVEKLTPITPENTLATLEEHARRIAEARRRQRNPDAPATLSSKDW